MLAINRGRWGIENLLFHVRDFTFGEDHCRVRKGTGPEALAAARNEGVTPSSTRPGTRTSRARRSCWRMTAGRRSLYSSAGELNAPVVPHRGLASRLAPV